MAYNRYELTRKSTAELKALYNIEFEQDPRVAELFNLIADRKLRPWIIDKLTHKHQ